MRWGVQRELKLTMPIHSIHTAGAVPTRHLHMYGLALERLEDRKAFDVESGRVIPYNRNFMQPNAAAKA